jgi:hypothetical protein
VWQRNVRGWREGDKIKEVIKERKKAVEMKGDRFYISINTQA